MQEINDELIDSFFKGLCTKEEAVAVLEFLKKHPDHPHLLREWDAADDKGPLPAHYTLDMYDAVAAHTGKDEKSNGRLRLLWRIAAAACVISIFISLWFGSVKSGRSPMITELKHRQVEEWVERQNTQDTSIGLQLPDGSGIRLSPKAWVRYRKELAHAARRDVYLQGQAFFEVAKNKEKPFTVYSGYISTTALGTMFRVTASDDGNTMKVQLNEGKVLVAVTDSASKKMHAGYYLSPGEEITFTSKTRPGIVRAFVQHIPRTPADKNKYLAAPAADQSYMFNNQTLAEVLDNLADIYHVHISYSKEELGKMYFIGRIERSDPIEKTIQDIALLNKLSVKKQNGGFILKRKNH